MIPKDKEHFPVEMYSAPPDSIHIEFAIMRCRSCDQMSDWSEVLVDHELAEETYQWELDHEDATGHKRFYVFRAERDRHEVLG